MDRVRMRTPDGWRRVTGGSRVRVVAGRTKAFRVRLVGVRGGGARVVTVRVTPPRRSVGRTGPLFVEGGQTAARDEPVVTPH